MTQNLSKDVKKHVAAIRISNEVGLVPRKMWNVLLLNAYDTLLTRQEHSIALNVLSEAIGYNSRNYVRLREALEKLSTTGVTWDVGGQLVEAGQWSKNFAVSSLLSWGKVEDGVLYYGFSPILSEVLYNPEIYQRINIAQQRLFKTSYGLALWENCIRYTNTGSTGMHPLEEWRQLLGATAKTYDEYRRFSQKVLTPAIREVNKVSNIEIKLKTKRTNRRVSHLGFQITLNGENILASSEGLSQISSSPEFKALLKHGITTVQAKLWIQEHGYEYIQAKLALLDDKLSNGSINTNPAGFLAAAIRDNYQSEQNVQAAAEKAARDKRLTAEQQRKLKAATEDLGREFDRQAKADYLDNLDAASRQQLLDEIMQAKQSDLFVVEELKRLGLHSPFVGLEILQRIPNYKRRRNKFIKDGLQAQGFSV